RHTLGLDGRPVGTTRMPAVLAPPIQEVSTPFLGDAAAGPFVLAVLAADDKGHLRPGAAAVVRGARFVADVTKAPRAILALVPPGPPALVQRWQPPPERFYGRDNIRRLLNELKQETGLFRLSDAEFIIDVGFGVGNRDGYEAVIVPLEKALRELGVRGLVLGG